MRIIYYIILIFYIIPCYYGARKGELVNVDGVGHLFPSSFNIILEKISTVPEIVNIDTFCIVPDLQLKQFINETKTKSNKFMLKSTVSNMNNCEGMKYCNNGGMAGSSHDCTGANHAMVSFECMQGVYQDSVQYIYESSVQTLNEAKNIIDNMVKETTDNIKTSITQTLNGFNNILNKAITETEATMLHALSDSIGLLSDSINKNLKAQHKAINEQFDISNNMYKQLVEYTLNTIANINSKLSDIEEYTQDINDLYASNVFDDINNLKNTRQVLSQIMLKTIEMSYIETQGIDISNLLSQWKNFISKEVFQDITDNLYIYYSDSIIGVYPNTSEVYPLNNDILEEKIYKCYHSRIYNKTKTTVSEKSTQTSIEIKKSQLSYKSFVFNPYLSQGNIVYPKKTTSLDLQPFLKSCFSSYNIYANTFPIERILNNDLLITPYFSQNDKLNISLYTDIEVGKTTYINNNLYYENKSYTENKINNVNYNNYIYLSGIDAFSSYDDQSYDMLNVVEETFITTNISVYRDSVDGKSNTTLISRICCSIMDPSRYDINKDCGSSQCEYLSKRDLFDYTINRECPFIITNNSYVNVKTTRTLSSGAVNKNNYILLEHETKGNIRLERCELASKGDILYLNDDIINYDYGMIDINSKLINTVINNYDVSYKYMNSMGRNTKKVKVVTGYNKNSNIQKLDIPIYYYTKDIWCCNEFKEPILTVDLENQCHSLNYTTCPSKSISNNKFYKSPRIYYCSKDRKYSEPYGIELISCIKSTQKLPGRGVIVETNIMSPSGLYPSHCIKWNSIQGKIPKYIISFDFNKQVIPTYINDLLGKYILYYINGSKVIDVMDNLYGTGNNGYDCINYEMDKMIHIPTNCPGSMIPSQDSVCYFSGQCVTDGLSRLNPYFEIVPDVAINNTIKIELRLKEGIDYPTVYVDKLLECPTLLVEYKLDSCIISGWKKTNYTIYVNDIIMNDKNIFKPSIILNNEGICNISISLNNKTIVCNIIKCMSSMNIILAYPSPDNFIIDRPNEQLENINTEGISISNKIDKLTKDFISNYTKYLENYNINRNITIEFQSTNISNILYNVSRNIEEIKYNSTQYIYNTSLTVNNTLENTKNDILNKGKEIYDKVLLDLQDIKNKYGNKTLVAKYDDSTWNFNLLSGLGLGISLIVIVIIIIIIIIVIIKR